MSTFDKIDTVEDFLKAVEQKSEDTHDNEALFEKLIGVATTLGKFRKKLMSEGFTRREALKFVEAYQDFIYSIATEQFVADKRSEQIARMNELADDIFDEEDEDEDDSDNDILA